MLSSPRHPQPSSGALRVLIADDDSSVRHLLRRFLEQDCQALADGVPDGLQLLERLTRGEYDLVLLDLRMPVMDGLETLAAIRRSPRFGNQKVIVLTGRHDEQMVREVVGLGVTDFIAKPLTLSLLRTRLLPHFVRDIPQVGRDTSGAPDTVNDGKGSGQPVSDAAASQGSADEAADMPATGDLSESGLDRALLDALPQAVWVTRPDGRTLHLNRRALELIGATTGTVAAKVWLALVHPDDADELRVRWQAAVRAEATFDFEFRLRRPDGSYRWCRSEGVPVRNAQGLADRWVGTWTDVDDARRLQRGLDRDTRVLELVNDAVVICDPSGVITYWGAGAERLLQWTAAEMLGRHVLERFSAKTAAELKARLETVAGGASWSGELEDCARDGSRVWTTVHLALHRHRGQPDSVIWIQQDLSARRRAEEALHAAQAQVRHLLERERTRGGWLRRTLQGEPAGDG